MTKKEISEELKVTERTVNRWVELGCPSKLAYVGRRFIRIFEKEDVKKWLEENKQKK